MFAGSGETKEDIGKCVAFVGAEKAYVGGDIVILRPHRSDSRFLGYLFNAPVVARQKSSKGQGDAVVHISASAIAAISIPLPPTKAEQQAIAQALSDADALVEALEQLLAKKRQIKQGAMQELLTGEKRLPGFSGEWEVKRLGELAEIDPEQLGGDTRPDYEFKYISLENVNCGVLEGYAEQVFKTSPSRARRKLLNGDILVSTVRPNLQSHLWFQEKTNNWICSTGFSVIRCNQKNSQPGYIFAHLFSDGISFQIDALLTGSNYPAINSRDVRQLTVPLPSIDEQTAIAAILSDMDSDIAALQAQLVKARQIKQGMMQELLTGRIRLVPPATPTPGVPA